MDTSTYLIIGALGLAIGSFLNVVIYRLPIGRNIAVGRSYCPSCKTQLKWYHNIPVLSYIALGGRCGFCKTRISFRYPLVELLTAGCFVYFLRQYQLHIPFFVFSALCCALIVIFFIDLDHQIIPDWITLPGIMTGLAVSFVPGGIGIAASAIGLAVGGGSLYLAAVLGEKLFKKEAMGGGDIKMAAMLGTFLGWQKVLLLFISAAVIGLVVSIIWMLVSARLRKERLIPFGPFLALGAMLAIVYGDRLIQFYIQNFLRPY
ncbi:prepilin peptidase [candidate division GN15 bacterium]|uniref:Prepilin leader peptidase/N-methyltransferase n=1 Tax=candidate division GN15 bacterium TaxID=2072418 RepID=A0A855XCK5_9BACT|nr:MAG: prepilin peptidase [candidate division GN15 bacterium]